VLLTPKYPQTPTVSTLHDFASTAPAQHTHAPICSCQQPQPTAPARRITPTLGMAAGAVTAIVAVGVVLTALVVAVAVAAVSVAVVAVVLRSLLTPPRHR
jgi:hypothetical protein